MSQYGEVEDIHLVREDDTGKSRGFAFIKYEDTRSCILAVDNFCGAIILGRSLRVDHVEQYRLPKKLQDQQQNSSEMDGKPVANIDNNDGTGHAYEGMEFENKYNIHQGMDLFAPPPPANVKKHEKALDGSVENKSRSIKRIEKMERKEKRQRKRLENEEKRQRREDRKDNREEKRRKKRAREYHGNRKND